MKVEVILSANAVRTVMAEFRGSLQGIAPTALAR